MVAVLIAPVLGVLVELFDNVDSKGFGLLIRLPVGTEEAGSHFIEADVAQGNGSPFVAEKVVNLAVATQLATESPVLIEDWGIVRLSFLDPLDTVAEGLTSYL